MSDIEDDFAPTTLDVEISVTVYDTEGAEMGRMKLGEAVYWAPGSPVSDQIANTLTTLGKEAANALEPTVHRTAQVPRRFVAIDLDTGRWLPGSSSLTAAEGAVVASSVLPGMPPEAVSFAYDEFNKEVGS